MGSLAQAIALAATVHQNQQDKGGEPYILHCIRVMMDAMNVEGQSEEVGIVAVLHDAIEDADTKDQNDLRMQIYNMFGADALMLIELLSRDRRESYLRDYIPRIINNGTWAITIKMADLRDNLNIRRQPNLHTEDLLRLQKYHEAYRMLRESRGI